ncbi:MULTISPECIES: DNA-binding protein [unclassified Frankia]|uniref:helix-turn-helix transcriptional regulator n=1 Tax=unclassified Frankia TaxID=2632575 RepID=UPI002AD3624A|nr:MULTISPECIES: DNA-binding protein [unclassified Frankia]
MGRLTVGTVVLITISDVAVLLGGVSRKRADQISRRETFPAPIGTTRSGRVWDEDQVREWIREHRTQPSTDE